MSKSYYDVVLIRPGQEDAYFSFYVKNITKRPDGTTIGTDELSTSDIIEASNEAEAIHIARIKYPGYTVDEDATCRRG